jgi:amidase
MPISLPTPAELREIAEGIGLSLTEADAASFVGLMGPGIEAYNQIEAMPDNLPAVRYPRGPGRRPTAEENRSNAWYIRTEIEGASAGKLEGKRVAIKDNVLWALSSSGTENRHKPAHGSSRVAARGSRSGRSSPRATVSGSVKA